MKIKILILIVILPIIFVAINVNAQTDTILYKRKLSDSQDVIIDDDIATSNISFDFDYKKDIDDCIFIDLVSNVNVMKNYINKLDYIMKIDYEINGVSKSVVIYNDAYSIIGGIKSNIYDDDLIEIDFYNERFGIVFNSPIDYISITQKKNISFENMLDLDENYAYIIDEYSPYLVDMAGSILEPFDSVAPTIIVDDNINTSIDNPISISTIRLNATAYDGNTNLTDQIYVSDTNYNGKELGDYYVILTVKDEYDNVCNKRVDIHVFDFTSPVVEGDTYYEVGIKNFINVEAIYESLVIKDNVSKEFTVKIEDNYTKNKMNVGVYDVLYRIYDEYLNETKFKISIKVLDDVKPVVKGSDINTSLSNPISIDEIISSFEISDNYSDSDKLTIEYDTDYNKLVEGEYYFKLQVTDEYNNITESSIIINVYDDIKPFFVCNDKIVNKPLSYDELLIYFNIK